MLIIRKNQINNLIATVSMNKTLPNPYYLFSFQHIASKERISFLPEVIVSNTRYDKFRFSELGTTNLNVTPPQVNFEYLGQYYYSIYEQVSSANTDPSLAFNKLESGRAVVIAGNDNLTDCVFEPYISDDENFAQVIYVSDDESICIPSVTPTNTPSSTPTQLTPTPTPSVTPTLTPTITCPVTTQYLEVQLSENTKFKLVLWNQSDFTSPANALCDYVISGCAYGDLGTIYCAEETIDQGQHQHQFNLAPVLQPGEIVTGFTVDSYYTQGCPCPVNLILPDGVNPNDLNALWWIDFTDASTLTINGSNIDNAVDKINGVNFSVPAAGTGPLYDPIGYLSVSGTAQEYVNELGSTDPLYTQNYSGMTWFGYMYDDFVTQQGGTIIRALVGFPGGTLLEFRDTANIPNSWRATVTTVSGDLTVDIDITYSAWTAIAVRIWEESGNVYLEVWENGSIIGQNSTSGTIVTPIAGTSMQLMFGGGVDLNTEQFFFNRKLTDSEMGQMFNYLNNKY